MMIYIFAGFFFTQILYWLYGWLKRRRLTLLEMVFLIIPGVFIAYLATSFLK